MNNDYRQISLDGWVRVGEGANGATYENPADPDVLLKVNIGEFVGLEPMKVEFETSQAVARLGLPTPAMRELVKVGDAYGIVSERIKNKKSLFRLCHDEPDRIEEMAQLFCQYGKQLFATPCDTSRFRSRKEIALEGIRRATYLRRKDRKTLLQFMESLPENTHCVHGDFQPGNLIWTDGKCYWIDLGRFAWGDPMFDIGHLYMVCNVYARIQQARDLFHLTEAQLNAFWEAFAKAYTGQEEHADFDRKAALFGASDVVMRAVYGEKPSFIRKIFYRIQVHGAMKTFMDV